MTPVEVRFTWRIRGSLHMGTGMSRLGEVDRIVRVKPNGEPAIEGEQIKGAVRGGAERLIHWLGASPDMGVGSFPRHPVLERLFAPQPSAFVRFEPARFKTTTDIVRVASTAINHTSGAADDHTLRTIEALARGASFTGRVAFYGDWSSRESRMDILFLCAAVLCTDAIGSRKGSGFGLVECEELKCAEVDYSALASSDTTEFKELRRLVAEVSQ